MWNRLGIHENIIRSFALYFCFLLLRIKLWHKFEWRNEVVTQSEWKTLARNAEETYEETCTLLMKDELCLFKYSALVAQSQQLPTIRLW